MKILVLPFIFLFSFLLTGSLNIFSHSIMKSYRNGNILREKKVTIPNPLGTLFVIDEKNEVLEGLLIGDFNTQTFSRFGPSFDYMLMKF